MVAPVWSFFAETQVDSDTYSQCLTFVSMHPGSVNIAGLCADSRPSNFIAENLAQSVIVFLGLFYLLQIAYVLGLKVLGYIRG